jgi:hypothetical protein
VFFVTSVHFACCSLHPNGTSIATGGLDGIVRLFDVRKFGDSRGSIKKNPVPLCTQVAGLSISSSFFSPSGKSLLTTSFANRLDLTDDAHLHTEGTKPIKPTYSIRHNNQTGKSHLPCFCDVQKYASSCRRNCYCCFSLIGRWLTTFQATWHPQQDIFCCGSMNKPRCIEIFNSRGTLLRSITGDAMTSVMSRTCFHPSTDKLVIVGGNSSGRVVTVR